MRKTIKTELILIVFATLIYSFAYAARVIYSANLAVITTSIGISKTQAGLISTGIFISYGIGQLLNGLFCKKYNPKYTIFFVSLGSAIANVLFAAIDIYVFKVIIWIINGVFQSFFYATLTCFASNYLDKKSVNKWVLGMGATTGIGCATAYGVSAIFANTMWNISFYIVAGLLTVIGTVWLFTFNPIKSSLTLQEPEAKEEVEKSSDRKIYILAMVFIFGLAVCTNILRDGLITWVPTYLIESYSVTDSISILITLLLPLFSFVSVYLHIKINNKIKCYPIVACIFLGVIVLALGLVFIGNIVTSCIGLIIAGVMACGVNSIILDGIAFSLRHYENAGRTVAIGDAFCYVGSALSGVALGFIIDSYSSNAFIITIIIIAAFELILSSLFSLFWKRKVRDASKD